MLLSSSTAVLPLRRITGLLSLAALLTSLSACSNGPGGKSLEQTFAADPKLQEQPFTFGNAGEREPQPEVNAQLPADFPSEIPRYQNAQLVEVTPSAAPGGGEPNNTAPDERSPQVRWVTSDPVNLVQNFYQEEFQANNWEILNQSTGERGGTLEARRNDLQVTVSMLPVATNNQDGNATPPPNPPDTEQNPEANTEFIIQYTRNPSATEPSNVAEAAAPPPDEANNPTPLDSPPPVATTPTSQSFTDIDAAPPELRQSIEDLAALGVLSPAQASAKSNSSATATQFQPGKTISHREFARWLFAANNRIYASRPSLQIRKASPTDQPAFPDVPRTDPDFPLIQGLAEAGLIPSSLSGESGAVLFRPDAPLTREQMLLWKVPLDTRQALPNASVDTVKQTWGFQDVTKIDPKALRAVAADFQNGDQSNIRRVFGYTTLLQPKKPVTRAEAAASLWFFGSSSEGISAQEALKIAREQNQPQPSASPEPTPSSSAESAP